ncbi:2Fe-2S iron-sulfur cluster binding domain-containing protein [Mycobacterium sp. SM1]|uniref:2Fe-2S iron-sulfur cluster binding domain-containing protein n=1 Tax=Mycobacterium sp. SM1 TaxID=2816243 RepID=UPI001BCBDBE4|nr:2Fe-2S iron-sulfur cluster binding domain-containing protein [Mycobacterium sp. SM1]MBS4730371.1 2Fe-2S iron-sulfur cluster binding domain-containing protein [Mycobacterium sp. SM1]
MSSLPELCAEGGAATGSFEAHVAGTDVRFRVRSGERILGAARRAGVWLPFECGWGSCSTCKATLVEGEVQLLFPEAPAVDPRDARRRRFLACQSTACSDITLKVLRFGPFEERPTRDYRAELLTAEELGPGIRRFRFRLDAASVYRPGQHAILEFGPNLRRCYSMAGLPGADTVEFIAKRYPGGPGSGALFSLSPGEPIPIELPYGDMWVRAGQRDVVLTAGGTGISAIIALVRQLADTATSRRVHVFYGANTRDELVCWDELQALVARLPSARLHGALAKPAGGWPGTTGFVTDALGPQLEALRDAEHYLAGPPVMVDAVLALLREHNTPIDRIHYDRFG